MSVSKSLSPQKSVPVDRSLLGGLDDRASEDVKSSLVASLMSNAIGEASGATPVSGMRRMLIEEIDADDATKMPEKEEHASVPSMTDGISILSTSHDDSSQGVRATETSTRTSTTPPLPKPEDGPTLMELMMEAQAAARKAKQREGEEQRLKEASAKTGSSSNSSKGGFGSGFKKGFFGNDSGSKKSSNAQATSGSGASTIPDANSIPTIRRPAAAAAAVVSGKAVTAPSASVAKTSAISKEVQEALAANSDPFVQSLRQGEWVTPDLLSMLQSNAILSRGLRNPKCMAALELMQKSPAEAKARFGSDEEVDVFMREFGRVMSEHFMGLDKKSKTTSSIGNVSSTGSSSNSNSNSSSSGSSSGKTTSSDAMGPLAAAAIEKERKRVAASGNRSGAIVELDEAEASVTQRQVDEVLKDEELRNLLMDAEMQRILMECNDPVRFRTHMSNPEISRKIRKLYEAGLVGMAK